MIEVELVEAPNATIFMVIFLCSRFMLCRIKVKQAGNNHKNLKERFEYFEGVDFNLKAG
ncbi:hypothetical protein CE131_07750 [Vibrio parahaemolyticus]|nr:hypothetical protein [Vibrio parahaemolyticus]EGR0034590.1 hypothetical protein [Vibrio parahaemolyticus]EGR0201522.1 hypothetical protein [Vibrio parahaemolyticus]EGR0253238.1 hypothetical protein [Vibrio parahaemolyticus]EGR2289113.1 hypothetical protein [Vibrio parahaemolyticus]